MSLPSDKDLLKLRKQRRDEFANIYKEFSQPQSAKRDGQMKKRALVLASAVGVAAIATWLIFH